MVPIRTSLGRRVGLVDLTGEHPNPQAVFLFR
jgi:hypothetical protein